MQLDELEELCKMPIRIVNINGIVMPIEQFINETLSEEDMYGVDFDACDPRIKRIIEIVHDVAYDKGYYDGLADAQ
jgi:hypothetical protein